MSHLRAEVYRRADLKWDWRTVAANNEVTSTSGGQGFENRSDAIAAAIRENALDTPIEIEDE